MRLAVKRGARAAVIYDCGFAELGDDGAKLQDEIAGLAREAGMPVCGPNCMGILNPPARVTTYKQNIMDPAAIVGNVGIVSQSGSVCIGLLSDLRRFGVSLSVSAGNEAVTRTVDYIEYLIDDPNTKVIATFTETVREPERYVAALDRAADAGKPVVVIKVGRTERTQRAITSHTGGLAGSSRVFSELLRAHRAIEVNDLDEMTEVLAVCQGERWPKGRGISVITGSGGLAELILDNATAIGLDLPPLSKDERAEAERVIGRITGDGNPFDAWGNGNYAVNLPHAMAVVDGSDRIDSICYCSDTSNDPVIGHPGRVLENVTMLTTAARKSQKQKPFYLLSTRAGVMNRKQVDAMRQEGLVVIGGTRQGLAALDRMGRWAKGLQPPQPRSAKPNAHVADEFKHGRRTINEFDAKRMLAAYGITVTREARVTTLSEAARAAQQIGYPVVLKAVSDEFAHKTELGVVAVNLKNEDDLFRAYAHLSDRIGRLGKRPADAAFLVQEFVADGIEVFAGDLARSGFRALARVRHRRHRHRDDPRFRAAHAAAARRRRRGDDRRDPRRGAAWRRARAGGGRHKKPRRLPLRAGRIRLRTRRPHRRDRPQPDQGASRATRLRRRRCADRHEIERGDMSELSAPAQCREIV